MSASKVTSRKRNRAALQIHNPVLCPISLPKKRNTTHPVHDQEQGDADHSPVAKKQYRSSDARWRKNLKQAFRILRDIACPPQSHIPVAGKNMRRDILLLALNAIEKLEDDISLFINIRTVREQFEEMELKSRFSELAADNAVSSSRTRKKKAVTQNVVIVKQELQSSRRLPAATYSRHMDPAAISLLDDSEVTAATESINIIDDMSRDADLSISHEDFDSYCLTSTPKLHQMIETGAGCPVRHSKTKFAASKNPRNVRRRLNMDEADEDFVVGTDGGGDGPQPASDQAAVDEYLETSFTQLLHMSQGGTIYCEPPVAVPVDGSFSDGPVGEIPVAFDIEIESSDFLLGLPNLIY